MFQFSVCRSIWFCSYGILAIPARTNNKTFHYLLLKGQGFQFAVKITKIYHIFTLTTGIKSLSCEFEDITSKSSFQKFMKIQPNDLFSNLLKRATLHGKLIRKKLWGHYVSFDWYFLPGVWRGAFPVGPVRDMPTFTISIFSKNSRTGLKISIKIPEQAYNFPEQVKFILKALLLVNTVTWCISLTA